MNGTTALSIRSQRRRILEAQLSFERRASNAPHTRKGPRSGAVALQLVYERRTMSRKALAVGSDDGGRAINCDRRPEWFEVSGAGLLKNCSTTPSPELTSRIAAKPSKGAPLNSVSPSIATLRPNESPGPSMSAQPAEIYCELSPLSRSRHGAKFDRALGASLKPRVMPRFRALVTSSDIVFFRASPTAIK